MSTNRLKKLLSSVEIPSLLVGIITFIYFSASTSRFFSAYNIGVLFNQMAVYGLLRCV